MATEFFDEWRTADRLATAAEHVVLAAFMHAVDGGGVLPLERDVAQARRLRAQASDLFGVAMAEMALKAERHRP